MNFDAPKGFRAAGTTAGLKVSGRPDLALIVSEVPCAAAAMFTRNRFPGAPVVVSRAHLAKAGRRMRAVVVNSGQANACTGPPGDEVARGMCEAAARIVGCRAEEVIVSSTGVIGRAPDLAKIESALPGLAANASPGGWASAAQGIMTTDTVPKLASREIRLGNDTVRILGIAKGSGMIHPSMATMLAFIATDARVNVPILRKAVRAAVERSFHCVTVDGDTSTSDMVVVLANGAAQARPMKVGTPEFDQFQSALTEVCAELARSVARDGEGATRLVTIHVTGARTEADGRSAAMALARSNLVKCALFGRDPNWGRLACAVGNSSAAYNPEEVVIRIGETRVFDQGRPATFDESVVHRYLDENQEIEIGVDLKAGDATASVWTCDLTYDYVKINAEYRT